MRIKSILQLGMQIFSRQENFVLWKEKNPISIGKW